MAATRPFAMLPRAMVFASPIFLFLFLPLTLAAYFAVPRGGRNGVLLVASLVFYAWGEAPYLALVIGSVLFNYRDRRRDRPRGGAGVAQALAGRRRGRQPDRARDLQVRELRRRERERAGARARDHAARGRRDPAAARHLVLHVPRDLVRRRRVQAQRAGRAQPAALRALHPAVPAAHRRPDHPLARHRVAAPRPRAPTHGGLRLRRAPLRARARQEGADRQHARAHGRPDLRAARRPSSPRRSRGSASPATRCRSTSTSRATRTWRSASCACSASASSRTSTIPYVARSIREFWRRWHISLSNWFRDYLYIPLGGNQRGERRAYANLVIVFLLCGLWHGASWPFVLWGAWHGAFLVIERVGLDRAAAPDGPARARRTRCSRSWAAGCCSAARRCRRRWATTRRCSAAPPATRRVHPLAEFLDPHVLFTLVLAVVFATPLARRIGRWRDRMGAAAAQRATPWSRSTSRGSPPCSCVASAFLAAGTYNPFIYFRF